MKCLVVTVFLACIFLPSTYSRYVEFFRKDYTYIAEFDAYYKVHWDISGTAWNTAFLTCDNEGATLFYPQVQGEWTLVKNLTEKMAEVPNVTDIFIGLHNEFDLGEFITVDGLPTPYPLPSEGSLRPHTDDCITMNINNGLFKVDSCTRTPDLPLPYVCKKVDNKPCPTVDRGYKFFKKSGKCYKINKQPETWQKAMKTCFMEGGILAVIENSVQAEEIKDVIEESKSYFVGVKTLLPSGDYYTVNGQKYTDMYQNPYNNGQNPYNNGNYPRINGYYPNENGQYPDENGQYPDENVVRMTTNCGSVRNRNSNNLYTEITNCDRLLPFICEMEVSL